MDEKKSLKHVLYGNIFFSQKICSPLRDFSDVIAINDDDDRRERECESPEDA
jgi:hypothetical protein